MLLGVPMRNVEDNYLFKGLNYTLERKTFHSMVNKGEIISLILCVSDFGSKINEL